MRIQNFFKREPITRVLFATGRVRYERIQLPESCLLQVEFVTRKHNHQSLVCYRRVRYERTQSPKSCLLQASSLRENTIKRVLFATGRVRYERTQSPESCLLRGEFVTSVVNLGIHTFLIDSMTATHNNH